VYSIVDKFFLAIDKGNRKMRWLGMFLVLLLTLVVVREVFMRYVFNSPSGITIELARSLQMYFGFLCAGCVQAEKAHLNMDSLLEYLRPKVKLVISVIGSLIGALYCGIMAYYCWLMLAASIRMHEVTAYMEWPMPFIKVAALIGFILVGLQFLADAWLSGRETTNTTAIDMST
jgi:C4-dicarboxylate transporter DctQ subunit